MTNHVNLPTQSRIEPMTRAGQGSAINVNMSRRRHWSEYR